MAQSFKALLVASVEGVVVEVWWGLVEKDEPRFAVFGFRSELLTCFCIHVCEIFIVICLIVECEFIVV